MQSTIALVLLFSLWTISFAADVTVYYCSDYLRDESQTPKPFAVSQFPWKFGYFQDIDGFLFISIINKSPSVTAINVTGTTDEDTFKLTMTALASITRNNKYYYEANHFFRTSSKMRIMLNLYTSNILCSTLVIADGMNLNKIPKESMKDEYPHFVNYNIVLVVDIMDKCGGPPSVIEPRERKMSTTTTTEITYVTDVQTINNFTYNSSTNLEITISKNSAVDIRDNLHFCKKNCFIIIVITILHIL